MLASAARRRPNICGKISATTTRPRYHDNDIYQATLRNLHTLYVVEERVMIMGGAMNTPKNGGGHEQKRISMRNGT